MTAVVAALNTDRLSLPALAALAEHARHAVGWECYSRSVRIELQHVADTLDANLSDRRSAFTDQFLGSVHDWRAEVRACMQRSRHLAVEEMLFLCDLAMRRRGPTREQMKRLTDILERAMRWKGSE